MGYGPRSYSRKLLPGDLRSTAEAGGTDCDWWRFEGNLWPCSRVESAVGHDRVGHDRSEVMIAPTTFEELRPGCYDAKARFEDMDDAHTSAPDPQYAVR